MGEDERATVVTLNAYRAVFRERVEAHHGRVEDMAGDSVLAVFTTAIGAVEAAVEIQKDLGARNGELPEQRRMAFRIGVNLGDIIEQEDGTVYGDGVNIAVQLQSIGEPAASSSRAECAWRGIIAYNVKDSSSHCKTAGGAARNLAQPFDARPW